MTPEEKAIQLIKDFGSKPLAWWCVKEIITALGMIEGENVLEEEDYWIKVLRHLKQ